MYCAVLPDSESLPRSLFNSKLDYCQAILSFFRAGLLDFDTALRTLEYLDQEVDFVPWKAALKELNFLRKSLQLTPAYGDFMVGTSYIINLYTLWTNSIDDKLVIFTIFLENRP